MTEEEWLTATDPKWMLDFVQLQGSVRKSRLTACASCARLEAAFLDIRTAQLVETVERFSDELVTNSVLDSAFFVAETAARETGDDLSDSVASLYSVCAEYETPIHGNIAERVAKLVATYSPLGYKSERALQAIIVRDIFPNPFRPVAFDPVWRTSTAVAIAQLAYDAREFGNLPVLADALQDAGCENTDILDHLRGPGPHVRGCWAVDLVLGKT